MTRLSELVDRARQITAQHRPRAGAGEWYRIANADGDRATVYIYDEISEWGISANRLVRELDEVTSPNIDVRLNSPGGSAWDGIAIYEALLRHPARVTTHVDAVAASAASVVAMAGDEVVIAKPARMFIHDALGLTYGNAADMRMMADLLDEVSAAIAEVYADRRGGSSTAWRDAMRANSGVGTWYPSAQAVSAGLADRVAEDPEPSGDGGEGGTGSTGEPDNRTAVVESPRQQLFRAGARLFPREGVRK